MPLSLIIKRRCQVSFMSIVQHTVIPIISHFSLRWSLQAICVPQVSIWHETGFRRLRLTSHHVTVVAAQVLLSICYMFLFYWRQMKPIAYWKPTGWSDSNLFLRGTETKQIGYSVEYGIVIHVLCNNYNVLFSPTGYRLPVKINRLSEKISGLFV